MTHLSAETKHAILLEYTPRSTTHGFAALAARHGVAGGRLTLQRWHQQWRGTVRSLQEKRRTGRPRLLSNRQVSQHVRGPILAANRAHRAVHYTDLLPTVRRATGKNVSIRTLRRYGKKELKALDKHTQTRTQDELSSAMCDEIAEFRRKLRLVPDGHLLFLDETALRVSEAPTHTLVLPGEQAYVVAEETSSYAKRFDMIACCTSKETLPPIIYAPNERRKGIETEMLIAYIRDFLAQAVGALDRYPLTLVLDRSTIHNTEKMLQAFHDWGCQELTEIFLMPSKSAKRLSPLDNALFHDWKERCRRHSPLTSDNIRACMSDEWNSLPPHLLSAHYDHCLLRPRQPLLADCPAPAVHRH